MSHFLGLWLGKNIIVVEVEADELHKGKILSRPSTSMEIKEIERGWTEVCHTRNQTNNNKKCPTCNLHTAAVYVALRNFSYWYSVKVKKFKFNTIGHLKGLPDHRKWGIERPFLLSHPTNLCPSHSETVTNKPICVKCWECWTRFRICRHLYQGHFQEKWRKEDRIFPRLSDIWIKCHNFPYIYNSRQKS